jgi:hypothetical protein
MRGYCLKKNAVDALAFAVMWVAYCLVVIIPNPQSHNWVALSGLLCGSAFMWLTGFALLALLRRVRPSKTGLAVTGAALVAADLLVKALVGHYLRGGAVINIVPGWLYIRFAPNYSNNVILNLLGVVVDSGLFHAAVKLASFLLVGALVFFFCRRQKGLLFNNRFRLATALLSAGAASSINESAFRGYIIDFVAFASIVAFDIKDLCLMYGVGLFILVAAHWDKDPAQA